MDNNQINDSVRQMGTPLKKNILIRFDSTTNNDLTCNNVNRPKRDLKTISKLKMTLPRLEPPSSQSKVSHWLKDCSHINFNSFQRPQTSTNRLLQAPEVARNGLPPPPPLDFDMDVSIEDRTVKQNILVRQDFHKNQDEKPVENVQAAEIRQSIDSNSSTETNRAKRKLLNDEAPLSPESRKKNELCSYLQLMDLKHPELKNGNIYKNRRSTRVKNLLIMTEKKELECKLRDEAKVKENSSTQIQEQSEILSKKSFQELNMLPEFELVQNFVNPSFTEIFHPIYMPKHLLDQKDDFEDFVKDFVNERQLLTKKEKYMKAKKNILKTMVKENRFESIRKLQLQRLKTLRKKQPLTKGKQVKNSKLLSKKCVNKKVSNLKKTNVKYVTPSIRSLRSTNKVILRCKTLRNLRKRNQNLQNNVTVKVESKNILESKHNKDNMKKKQVDAATGKENHKKKDPDYRKKNVELKKNATNKKIQISGKNNLNVRKLRNSLQVKEVNNTIKPKPKIKEIINKSNSKTTKKQNLENKEESITESHVSEKTGESTLMETLKINSPEIKHRNNFKIIKYDFEKSADEIIMTTCSPKVSNDSTKIRYNFMKRKDDTKTQTIVQSFKSKTETQVIDMPPADKKVDLSESEKINDDLNELGEVVDELSTTQNVEQSKELECEIDETLDHNISFEVIQCNSPELKMVGNENEDMCQDVENEVVDQDDDGLVDGVGVKDTEGMETDQGTDDNSDGGGKEDEVDGISGVGDKMDNGSDGIQDDDDDVIYVGTEIIPEGKQDVEISTALPSKLTPDHHAPKTMFSVKTLEDIEKKYSTLSFNISCIESDDDTSGISEVVLEPCLENSVFITNSSCSDEELEYQINIAISEHNYTRSPGSVPIEYELVECESIVENSSSLPEEGMNISEENSLDLLKVHTLDEIKRIIHGDLLVTQKSKVPSEVNIVETHNSIEEGILNELSVGSEEVLKTSDKPCDNIFNNNEEKVIPTNSCSSVNDFEQASLYKLNECNSISNDSKGLEEGDLLNLTVQEITNDTCDITELQSSVKPIRNNGSHEDFKGFNNSLKQRQSPKLIEFNEKNLPKSMIRRSDMKSLHRNLLQNKRKSSKNSDNNKDDFDSAAWVTEKNEKKSEHTIHVQEKDGEVLDANYFDYNLIITQDLMISFWTQSPLGFMLEAQNMWIPRGSIQRLALDNNCVQKSSKECVLTAENSFAYVELWTKEHKSDKRERPVADVFAVIYFWRNRQMGPEKKFLQLENINGFADDVHYVVLKNSAMILVSWRKVRDETTSSIIHCYQLANDFQTVVSIKEMESVEHTISSLHNIEDCDTLVMACGEKQVTIWNLEHGFIVATIDTSDNLPEPLNLWVKCDRGFLFLLQHCSNNIFKLIAINGINQSWKRLQIYKPPPMGFDRFRGVCIENGILIAFYSNGILCWNVQSGDLIMEELCNDVKYLPAGKHIITYTSDNLLQVKNALSFLITNYDFSES